MSKSDTTPRFTEADMRRAHRDGWKMGKASSPNYRGGYNASFWDRSELRNELGLTPPGSEFYRAHKVKHDGSFAAHAAANTEHGYSFSNYGEAEWAKCAAILVAHGCNQAEAEAFLLSKHMRWCYDKCDDPLNATAAEFAEYLRSGINRGGKSVVEEARDMM